MIPKNIEIVGIPAPLLSAFQILLKARNLKYQKNGFMSIYLKNADGYAKKPVSPNPQPYLLFKSG